MNKKLKNLRLRYKNLSFREKQLELRKKMWEGIRNKSFHRTMTYAEDGQTYDVLIQRLNNEHFTILIDGEDSGEGEFPTALTALDCLAQLGFCDKESTRLSKGEQTKSLNGKTKSTRKQYLSKFDQQILAAARDLGIPIKEVRREPESGRVGSSFHVPAVTVYEFGGTATADIEKEFESLTDKYQRFKSLNGKKV